MDQELTNSGRVRTDMYCHDCDKNFLAEINFDLDGNHRIVCPHCGHNHYRVVTDGKVTDDRWSSAMSRDNVEVEKSRTWKGEGITTGTSCRFLRDKWLNR